MKVQGTDGAAEEGSIKNTSRKGERNNHVREESGKHWVTEIERSRNIMWHGKWQRVENIAEALKQNHPESFRHKLVRCRNGEQREIWAFTKVT